MSRIRSVKPEWLEDELILGLSSDARVLSISLLLLADDYGNGRGGEKFLGSRVFPGQPLRVLKEALDALVRIRFVTLYEIDGQTYYSVRNWRKHQRVDKPGPAKVPGPPANVREQVANAPDSSPNLPGPLATDQEEEGDKEREEEGEEDAREKHRDPSRGPPPPPADRFKLRPREPGAPPSPRDDPLRQRFEFRDWFPSGQWVEYWREVGLTDREVDAMLVEARDKLDGLHDVGWYDVKVERFTSVAVSRKAKPPGLLQHEAVNGRGTPDTVNEVAVAEAKRARAERAAKRGKDADVSQ